MMVRQIATTVAPRAPRPGRQPGDIAIEGKNGRFSLPVVTCVIISMIFCIALWIYCVLIR